LDQEQKPIAFFLVGFLFLVFTSFFLCPLHISTDLEEVFEDVGCRRGTGLKHVGCRLGDGRELIERGLGEQGIRQREGGITSNWTLNRMSLFC
jgi:hypothetical protein